ncbi:EF-hand calcium-binding domain-containing protein 13-like isoform X2 [Sceloporus undulatus]|uniref:EF-hand calcium-binding domain-containing protein 13-like isoform X2 n=1 Tax=Sceloporus undulatus TaxID=8520 RepID=UPI001C4C8608|nr:EF-hand calcium-binding domain-containing protein 13-like isoform X2 [Sceloporus undulatus]
MKVVENIKLEKMSVNDLAKTLENMGVRLPNTIFNELVKAAKTDANGKIDFKDFLLALGETEDFAELEALQRAITSMDATCGSQLHINELHIALDNLGIHLSNDEFQEVLHAINMKADGTVNLKDFLVTLSKMKRFTDSESLHSNVCAFCKIKGEKVDVGELESMLNRLGIDLNKREFQKALKGTSVDENGKVSFKEFLVNVMDNERFSESSALHNVYSLINIVDNDKVEVSQMKDVLDAIGVTLSKKEMKEVQKNIPVDSAGKVTLKDFMNILPHTRQFSTAVEMEEAMKTMNSIKQDKANIEDLETITRRMDLHLSPDEIQQALKYVSKNGAQSDTVAVEDVSSLLSSMGIQLTKEQLEDSLKHVKVDENGKVNIAELLKSVEMTQPEADMDKVHVQDLDAILTKMGIYLIEDEVQKALKYAHIDEHGRINLNDFLNGMRKSVQLIVGAEGKVIEIGDLNSSLAQMGIHLTEEEMQDALKHVVFDIDGRVNLKDVLESVMFMQRPSKHERDKVSIEDLDNILASAGIHLREKELQEALKNTSADTKGMVNLGEFMKWVRVVLLHLPSSDGSVNFSEFSETVQESQGSAPAVNGKVDLDGPKEEITDEKVPDVLTDGWTKEKMVDIDSLDAVLDEIGIHLTNKQLYEALKYSPMDADGKVELEPFMRGVNAILATQKSGKSVDVSNLESILADMGLHLTQDELQQALRQTTLNKDGSVNLKDFMWAIQTLPSIQSKQVHINNLDSVLSGMGIYLSQEELQDALKLTKSNENGMVNLKDFIRACNATLTLSSMEGRYPGKMSNAKPLKLPKVLDKYRCPPNSGRMFSSVTPSKMVSFKAVKELTKPQLEAFRDAYDTFTKDLDGNVDLSALETTAHKLGINLTEEEAFDELVYADTDGDGKVNFTDFLNIITDSKRFIQAVAPNQGDMETVDARGILLFELVSKLVETSMLSRKTTVNIVSYYRKMFLEATGKKAWRADSIDEGAQRRRRAKKSKVAKARSTPMSAFAGAARICVMNDQELRDYLEQLQDTIKPSESPYAQVPIFPLIPNRDIMLKGRPKKDLQKLEAQRRMEPLASFEDHFFRKKRWLKQEPKPSKPQKPLLTLAPALTHRRLTLDNLDDIRKEVKRVTTAYRMSIALRERNKSLKLWRRLRGGEIGLETGNSTFYETFSTYSWSWNVCQELLTPRELQEYDNKLYHGAHRLSVPAEKQTRATVRQNGSKK